MLTKFQEKQKLNPLYNCFLKKCFPRINFVSLSRNIFNFNLLVGFFLIGFFSCENLTSKKNVLINLKNECLLINNPINFVGMA